MTKPLSEQLSSLSARAKRAEDAATAAQKEAHDKIVARRAQTRAAAVAAFQQVDQDIKSADEASAKGWAMVQAKVTDDLHKLKAQVDERKQNREFKHAENHAERLEEEASFAIDYANASIEQAQLAVLDAIIGRIEVEETRRA
jgi:hypothetical protein